MVGEKKTKRKKKGHENCFPRMDNSGQKGGKEKRGKKGGAKGVAPDALPVYGPRCLVKKKEKKGGKGKKEEGTRPCPS